MTYKEAQQWLNRGYRIRERIAAKLRRIENWHELATSITSTMKDVAVAPSVPSKKVENFAVNVADMEMQIQQEIAELKYVEALIAREIREKVDVPNYLAILEMRYTAYMKWEEIAVAMNYTLRWVMAMHQKAVLYFAEKAL